MVRARQDFLSKGYYSFLSEEVNRIALGFLKGSPAPVVADVGCGEGYYTGSLCTFLRDHRVEAQVYGFDIAKYALQLVAKRCRQVTYAVASLSKIPLPDVYKRQGGNHLLSVFVASQTTPHQCGGGAFHPF